MVYDMPPNDAGQHERDLRAPSLKMQVTPNSVIVPNPGSRRPTPTGGSVSPIRPADRPGPAAVTRKELKRGFLRPGRQIPTSSRALGVHPAYQPLVRPETRQQAGRGVAG